MVLLPGDTASWKWCSLSMSGKLALHVPGQEHTRAQGYYPSWINDHSSWTAWRSTWRSIWRETGWKTSIVLFLHKVISVSVHYWQTMSQVASQLPLLADDVYYPEVFFSQAQENSGLDVLFYFIISRLFCFLCFKSLTLNTIRVLVYDCIILKNPSYFSAQWDEELQTLVTMEHQPICYLISTSPEHLDANKFTVWMESLMAVTAFVADAEPHWRRRGFHWTDHLFVCVRGCVCGGGPARQTAVRLNMTMRCDL